MGDFLKLWFGGGFLELGLRWWVEENLEKSGNVENLLKVG